MGAVLQTFVFPDQARADRTALYARWPDGDVRLAAPDGSFSLAAGSRVDFCTFFNAFSHRKWEQQTGIDTLELLLSGRGRVRVVVQAYSATAAAWPIADLIVDLHDEQTPIVLGDPTTILGDSLAVEMTAMDGDAAVQSAGWATQATPKRAVHLAAVIVTFRREAAARDAIARFRSATIPGAPGPMHLYVIDNGETLDEPSDERVTILKNRNLGGAGGFARGLIEALDAGRFTHALFMDDDASCEPESVWRTMALSAYLRDERAAVAGAMLLTSRPLEQHEKGAHLELGRGKPPIWRPLGQGTDLAHAAGIVGNDGPDRANYGAFWFFAFPLAAVTALPFPFFVRGDDTDFSLSNRFPIVTLNGIASWCDHFGSKLSQCTEYLTYRSWFALMLMHGDRGAAARSLRAIARNALTFGFRFDYACLHAILDALEDAAQGPRFFADHPAPVDALKRVGQRVSGEPLVASDFARIGSLPGGAFVIRLAVATLTLGGHLLPQAALKRPIPHVQVAWEAGRFALVRSSAVVVGTGATISLYRRNLREMMRGLRRLLTLYPRLWRKLPALEREYRSGAAQLRTADFWRGQFDKPAH